VLITLTATLGMMGVAAGLSGYLITDMNLVERVLAIAGGLLLIIPGLATDFGGVGLIALAIVFQWLRAKKKSA